MITLSLLHPLKQVPVQVWTFQDETSIRIGRSTDNQVILYSAVVSRHHVELRKLGNGWEIVNLGTNGTYLDGKRITQVIATDGAVIRLARSGPNIQIRFGDSALQAEAMADPEKTTGQGGEASSPTTEVTTGSPGQIPELGVESLPSQATLSPGTIPVPNYLSLAPGSVSHRIDPGVMGVSDCIHVRAQSLFCPDCGAPNQSIQTVGEYVLIDILGQGAIGITYLGWHNGNAVVIKTLNQEWATNPKAHAALEYEADLLRALHHPRIPHVLDFFWAEGQPYLVMERMQGLTVHHLIHTRGAVSFEQAIAWLIDLCATLDYLHSQTPPVVHRGICPSSLIRMPMEPHATSSGRGNAIALVGFGQVKASILGLEHALNQGYTVPEALEVGAPPSVDLISLAPVFVYLLTGKSPTAVDASLQGDRFAIDSIPGLSAEGAKLLHQLTHPHDQTRYQHPADVTQALQSLLVSP